MIILMIFYKMKEDSTFFCLLSLRDVERKLIPVEMHFMRWIANHNHFGQDRNQEVMILVCIS
jgi:hypothetical protein